MATTTLADLIADADNRNTVTRWLLNAIRGLKPSAEKLAAPAVERDKALPNFRKKAGGVIEVDGVLIGAHCGTNYFNGQVGPWKEIKPLLRAWLTNGTPVKAIARKAKKSVRPAPSIPLTNEAMNLHCNGPVETRKTWINYEAIAETNERFANENA